jgi:hypothetical protein
VTGPQESSTDLRLAEAWTQCCRHLHHLRHALSAVRPLLPMTAQRLRSLDDEAVQDWDQLILRMTKLQDAMGARLFPATLERLQEPYEDRPMLDRLHRLEQLGLLPSAEDWQRLRVIRNRFAHDYPEDDELKAAMLNEAAESVTSLAEVLSRFERVAGKGLLD